MTQAHLWLLPPCYFHEFPLVLGCFCCFAPYYPLPMCLCKIGVAATRPFWSAHASAVRLSLSCLNIGSMVGGTSRSFYGLLSADTVCSSLFGSYTGTATDALCQLYFFISILILALYLFILREVTKREPALFPALPWTASRPWTMIFPWIFLFLYRQVFAYGQ